MVESAREQVAEVRIQLEQIRIPAQKGEEYSAETKLFVDHIKKTKNYFLWVYKSYQYFTKKHSKLNIFKPYFLKVYTLYMYKWLSFKHLEDIQI